MVRRIRHFGEPNSVTKFRLLVDHLQLRQSRSLPSLAETLQERAKRPTWAVTLQGACFQAHWQTDFAYALALTGNGGWFLSLEALALSWEPRRLDSYFPFAG